MFSRGYIFFKIKGLREMKFLITSEIILESRIIKYGRKLDSWILESKWNSFRKDVIFKNRYLRLMHCKGLRIFLIIDRIDMID